MNKSTAAAAAGAVALATTGAVSALFLTVGAPTTAAADATLVATPAESITIEYVDENGNPVAAPVAADAEFLLSEIEFIDAPAVGPIIETEYQYVTTAAPAPAASSYTGEEYEDDDEYEEHEEGEDEDHDEYEDDDEYEEDDDD